MAVEILHLALPVLRAGDQRPRADRKPGRRRGRPRRQLPAAGRCPQRESIRPPVGIRHADRPTDQPAHRLHRVEATAQGGQAPGGTASRRQASGRDRAAGPLRIARRCASRPRALPLKPSRGPRSGRRRGGRPRRSRRHDASLCDTVRDPNETETWRPPIRLRRCQPGRRQLAPHAGACRRDGEARQRDPHHLHPRHPAGTAPKH